MRPTILIYIKNPNRNLKKIEAIIEKLKPNFFFTRVARIFLFLTLLKQPMTKKKKLLTNK